MTHLNVEKKEMSPMTDDEIDKQILGVIFAQQQQYSLEAGLKKFGDKAKKAVIKELTRLHDMVTFIPMDASTMTKDERAADLVASVLFITEKHNGDIKARQCVDGRKQCGTIENEDVASPTVSLERIMLTVAIEAYERCHISMIDLPGAFLQADTNEDVNMMLKKGGLAEFMALVEPKLYRKYVFTNSKGETMLYVKI